MTRHLLLALTAVLLSVSSAAALDQSAVPPKFPLYWGQYAGSAYIRSIPQASQIGIQNGAASLTDGFPPRTFVPANTGGVPPFGQDFNGILRQLSQWSQWAGAGAFPLYDSSFSASIGGYPSGATLANAATPGCFWVSIVDGNASDPDTGGLNWISWCPGNVAYLTKADQTLSGGANVVSGNLGTISAGTTTIDCGKSPLQYFTNGGALTLAAPASDGSCMILMTNNGSAGAVTWSGFTVGPNTGDALTTTNASKFMLSILRINGTSTFLTKSLQ